jgi:hypothetical protein
LSRRGPPLPALSWRRARGFRFSLGRHVFCREPRCHKRKAKPDKPFDHRETPLPQLKLGWAGGGSDPVRGLAEMSNGKVTSTCDLFVIDAFILFMRNH